MTLLLSRYNKQEDMSLAEQKLLEDQIKREQAYLVATMNNCGKVWSAHANPSSDFSRECLEELAESSKRYYRFVAQREPQPESTTWFSASL